jgi:hypothetical protein
MTFQWKKFAELFVLLLLIIQLQCVLTFHIQQHNRLLTKVILTNGNFQRVNALNFPRKSFYPAKIRDLDDALLKSAPETMTPLSSPALIPKVVSLLPESFTSMGMILQSLDRIGEMRQSFYQSQVKPNTGVNNETEFETAITQLPYEAFQLYLPKESWKKFQCSYTNIFNTPEDLIVRGQFRQEFRHLVSSIDFLLDSFREFLFYELVSNGGYQPRYLSYTFLQEMSNIYDPLRSKIAGQILQFMCTTSWETLTVTRSLVTCLVEDFNSLARRLHDIGFIADISMTRTPHPPTIVNVVQKMIGLERLFLETFSLISGDQGSDISYEATLPPSKPFMSRPQIQPSPTIKYSFRNKNRNPLDRK